MVVGLGSLGALVFALPLAALVWRAPWRDLGDLLGDPALRDALGLSLLTSVATALVCLGLGLPLAWLLARYEFRGRRALRALALLPMVLPPVVGGLALLLAFGRRGVVGQHLDAWFGIRLPFTTTAAIIAQTFVALPFLVVTAESAFRAVDQRYEDAARTLGAGRATVFRRVTVPMCAPVLAAGVVLAWARALGEFGATITFAGNVRGETQTLPLSVFLQLETGDVDGAIAASLVLLAVSAAVLVGLREHWLGAIR
ncbi:MAG TPA: ABC transporter permease [Acidimicrobiia bacterium]|nr:ABC transporter permease [Acidimicrobiia bacterium]